MIPYLILRFSKETKLLLGKMLVTDPKERIKLEDVQKNAWYNKGFESEAPRKYTPITVTEDQLAGAVSPAEMVVEMDDAPAASTAAAASSAAPTYVWSPMQFIAEFKHEDGVVDFPNYLFAAG